MPNQDVLEHQDRIVTAQNQPGQIAPDDQPCNKPDCTCCSYWIPVANKLLDMAARTAGMAEKLLAERDSNACVAKECRETREKAEKERQKYAGLNKQLNVEINGIRIVPVSSRKSSGRKGRPKGQEATINRRTENIDREETVDCEECPHCGGELSGITDGYDRVVKEMKIICENVKYNIKRRYCRMCKKQVSAHLDSRTQGR